MKYKYNAISESGKKVVGSLVAEDKKELEAKLKKRGLVLLSAEPKRGLKKLFSFGNVSLKEKIFFTRNLQVMTVSGLSLTRSLEYLSSRVSDKNFGEAIAEIEKRVSSGKKFSESLLKYPEMFSNFFYNMIKSGEETGKMAEVLGILTHQMEKTYQMKSKIISALIYPAVIVFVMLCMFATMLVVVVPRMSEVFDNIGTELPVSTRIVMGTGRFLSENGIILLLFFIIIFAFFSIFIKTGLGNKLVSFLSLKIPIVTKITKNKNSAHIGRTLSSLLKSGVSINRALGIVADTTQNYYLEKAVLDSSREIKKGRNLSEAFKKNGELFSPLFIQMVEVGEETGATSGTLLEAADFLEEEVTRSTMNLTSIIEPALMIVIGIFVGFFAFSMLQPMYSIIEVL